MKDWKKQRCPHCKKTFPNYNNIVQKYAKGETWLPDDFPAIEYSRDVISWFLRHFKENKG